MLKAPAEPMVKTETIGSKKKPSECVQFAEMAQVD
jgi:hypothetical protein